MARPFNRIKLGCLALVIGLGFWFAPTGLQIYHIERAGALMDRGMTRPASTQIDQLPQARDRDALELARQHLVKAIAAKPDAHAYRLLGQVYASSHAWLPAAEAFDQAKALDGNDPLIRWEAALVEAQLWRETARADQQPLALALQSTILHAPAEPITTPFCQDGQPASCYVALTSVAQPLAAAPGQPYTATAVFTHPPAGLTFALPVSGTQTALVFLLGLVPAAIDWNTDGVTYEVWAGELGQEGRLVYQRTLDQATLARGWTADWIDLRAWSGRTISLTLRADAGPQHETTSDWAVWGDFTLTSAEQAPAVARYPRLRMHEGFAWSGYNVTPFRERADQLFRQGDWAGAFPFYQQALQAPGQPADAQFRAALAGAALNRPLRDVQNQLGLPTRPITAATLIQGESMHWLQSSAPTVPDGAPMDRSVQSAAWTAPLWWSGAAVAVIEATASGAYTMTIRVISSPGAAAQLALEYDGQALEQFQTSADGSFTEHRFQLDLAAGTHVVAVRFLNNGIINGVDNNAFIDWLRFTR